MDRAIIVCNSFYPESKKSLPKLQGPVWDGLFLWKQLTDPITGVLSSSKIEVLFNADKNTVMRSLERVLGACERGDVVLIYFSGHARRAANELYLCVLDTDAALLVSSAISAKQINDMVGTFLGGRQTVYS